ncbi:MAG: GumC family protein [Methylococcaceae bacterium]
MKNLSNENFASALADILYSQKKAVQITFILVFFSFVAYAVLAPDVYQANGSLLFQANNKENNVKILGNTAIGTSIAKSDGLSIELKRIVSSSVLLNSANKLIVEKLINMDAENSIVSAETLADKISKALVVKVDNDSNVIALHLTWANAEDARIILDKIMQDYVESRLKAVDSGKAVADTGNSVLSYLDGWKKKKAEALEVIKKHNAPDAEHELINNLALKKDFQMQVAVSEKETIGLNEDIKILTSMLNDGEMHLYSFLSNDVLNGLIESLKAIKKEKLDTDRIFLPSRVEVKEINQLFNASYKELKQKISVHLEKQKSILQGVENNIAGMKNSIKDLDKRNIELKEVAIKMEQLKMEASLIASSFESSYKRQDMPQANGLFNLGVTVLSAAKVSLTPVRPGRYQIVVLGFILAICITLCVALFMNIIDDKIKTSRDIQKYIDVPVLFSIGNVEAKQTSFD